MMLKRSTTKPQPSVKARLVRAGVASLVAATAVAALATGCLDRPVVKAEPKTSNVFVDQIVQTAVDKIDLLFMIDNSVSMADKQEILKSAVPLLVSRLVTPICLDANGAPIPGAKAGDDGKCAQGSAEFSAIGDIHIGIVSSSLGAHGGAVCATAVSADDHLDDKAHLIPSVRMGVASYQDKGFLAWDHSGKANKPAGENNATALNTAFANMIAAVGEHGCGYEASLESWYRFLVDPEPPESVTLVGQTTVRSSAITTANGQVSIDPATGKPMCTGCHTTLLAQRAAFLRPDSLVAIVMLSDENDCSIRDDGVGWFVGAQARMPLSTKICETDPNNQCCRSCAQKEDKGPPAGCAALSADDTCKTKPAGQSYATWDALHDSLNLRCYNQHQRFGFDLLYETGRYVNGLTSKVLTLQSNPKATITNPLYDNAGSDKAPRDASLVFLAGIVGVPWQDIADDASLAGPGLNYLTAKELLEQGRWDQLLGTPSASPVVPPLDPFMRETTEVRSGTNTIANVAIVPASSMNPKANVINGHEQNIPDFADLQYACIFPKTPKVCMAGDSACDCSPDKMGNADAVVAANSPLCQPTGGGPAGTTQSAAKAYPGARELTVLKDFGNNAIVASICPKITDTANADYGYNPAVGAIIARLKDALKGKCLPRPLATDDNGQALCKVIEAQKANCDCTVDGRGPADPTILAAVRTQLKESGNCGNPGQAPCDSWCECEIKQEDPTVLKQCQGNQGGIPAGYCYVDAKAKNGANDTQTAEINAALAKCPDNQQQLLRFVTGEKSVQTPAQGSVAFIACLGANVEAAQ
ncbi:MAG: hypothetical protein ABIQ16_23725 [Polyangiaceae bacterium]